MIPQGKLQPIYCAKCGKLLDYTVLPIYGIEASCKPDCTSAQTGNGLVRKTIGVLH